MTLPKNQTGDEEPDDIGEPGGGCVPPPSVPPCIGNILSWSRRSSSLSIRGDIGGLASCRSSLERDLCRPVLLLDGDGDLLRKSLPSLRGMGFLNSSV